MLAGILVMTMSKLYYKGKKVLLCKKTTLHKDPCSEHHSDDVFDKSCSKYLIARIFFFEYKAYGMIDIFSSGKKLKLTL